jgi:hypothetical protein
MADSPGYRNIVTGRSIPVRNQPELKAFLAHRDDLEVIDLIGFEKMAEFPRRSRSLWPGYRTRHPPPRHRSAKEVKSDPRVCHRASTTIGERRRGRNGAKRLS